MLTRLRFKNWRSLRDVEIDHLTPLTVFIGANSSGKTNILDALHFLRFSITEKSISETVYRWGGRDKIRRIGTPEQDPIELGLSFALPDERTTISDTVTIGFVDNWITLGRRIKEDDTDKTLSNSYADTLTKRINELKKERWQLLREDFFPRLNLNNDRDFLEDVPLSIIDPLARNVPFMLNFMQQSHPDVFSKFQTDLGALLNHVDSLQTERDEREIRLFIRERVHQGLDAPTVSAGTARIIAMLTAYHALDMANPEQPGLVVIEEPDTAVHPLLLSSLVDLLRGYTERKEPRQFILTTHNPHLLDYFEPEEVRVVERDPDTGDTHVDVVPDYIKETWLHKHTLGDAWTSRIIGGIPEE